MPYFSKFPKKRTRRNSRYYKKRRRFSRKKYKNRQQLLSIKTVKTIAKKAVVKDAETNFIELLTPEPRAIGNPILHDNAGSLTDLDIPKPRSTLLTDYTTCYKLDNGIDVPATPTTTNGSIQYLTKQDLYLKNIQIKLQILSPVGSIGHTGNQYVKNIIEGQQWATYHWAILKSADNPQYSPVMSSLFKDRWEQQSADFVKNTKTSTGGFTIVKQGKFPLKQHTDDDDDFVKRQSMYTRRTINVPIKKTMKILRHSQSSGTADATITGNKNSVNYWYVSYVHLFRQSVQTLTSTGGGDKQYCYNGQVNSSYATGTKNYAPYETFTITISGHGKNPTP